MKSLLATLLLFTAGLAAAQDTSRRIGGFVRNSAGAAIADLTIHFYQKTGDTFAHLTTKTAANGLWTIDLPPGEWRAAATTDDLLSRGYFCGPGFVWCGSLGEFCDGGAGGDDWPLLWGEGEIVWTPIGGNPGIIILTIVPTRPELSVEKPRTQTAGVKVTFETTEQDMTLIRQWRIEKSSDLLTWTPLRTVALSGTSPVIVPDPDGSTAPVCYYRAVQVEDVVTTAP